MRKHTETASKIVTEATPACLMPSDDQIESLARRMMPEIKRFFADEQILKEFARWQERRSSEK